MPWPTGRPAGSRSLSRGPLGLARRGRRWTAFRACPTLAAAFEIAWPNFPDTPGWTAAQAALDPGPDPAATLTAVVDAALAAYAVQAHGQPTMLVHAVTAPAAVARVLPSLSPALARPSVDAAWAATAAVFAAYRPRSPLPPIDPGALSTDDAWEQALAHGGEHVLKLADVALVRSTHPARRTGLSATLTAISQDA